MLVSAPARESHHQPRISRVTPQSTHRGDTKVIGVESFSGNKVCHTSTMSTRSSSPV